MTALNALSYHVLLVEDNKAAQLSATYLLKKMNCHVRVVESGEAAVAVAAQETFDLILMDVGLPGIDGLTATQQIRAGEKNKRCLIAALSAHVDQKEKGRCLDAGIDMLFNKPLSLEQCANLMREVIQNSRKCAQ